MLKAGHLAAERLNVVDKDPLLLPLSFLTHEILMYLTGRRVSAHHQHFPALCEVCLSCFLPDAGQHPEAEGGLNRYRGLGSGHGPGRIRERDGRIYSKAQ